MHTSSDEHSEDFPVYQCRKKCRECGEMFDGKSFLPPTEEDDLVVYGICDPCAKQYQESIEHFTTTGPKKGKKRGKGTGKTVELEKPVTSDDYDQRYR